MIVNTIYDVSGSVKPQDELTKQRMKLHMKVLGHSASNPKLKEDKPTYKERFVPPEVSMISYFMTKVGLTKMTCVYVLNLYIVE